MRKLALILGGGAPNFTLITGALLAFDEAGVKFDLVSGAGGGGAAALIYLAPKGMSRQDMLRNSVNIGVSDPIFNILPINYKVFQKGGKLADLYRSAIAKLPFYQRITNQYGMSRRQKLFSDLFQMLVAATTPSLLNPFSKGLCANAPFIDHLVDFEKLKKIEEEVYISAYCLNEHKLEVFGKDQIDAKVFGASLSYPFFYPPTEMNGKMYIEGAGVDAFNFQSYFEHGRDRVKTIVLFDLFGQERYLRPPKNLFQAYSQNLILALISLSRYQLVMAERYLERRNQASPRDPIKLIKVQFDIPDAWLDTALDWSSSNLERNFNLGYEVGKKLVLEKGPTFGHQYKL